MIKYRKTILIVLIIVLLILGYSIYKIFFINNNTIIDNTIIDNTIIENDISNEEVINVEESINNKVLDFKYKSI
jgi:hypothetical protein